MRRKTHACAGAAPLLRAQARAHGRARMRLCGQILSTRYDILPYDYVKGLERLQDSVPAFDGNLAYEIVVGELGANAFRSFELTPIAAASLGQVHLATTADGRQVAVKVQRPGLKALFDADLVNLKILAELLYKLDKTPDAMLRDWREIFESNAKIIYEEIDYTQEAANGKRFAANFAEHPWVKVPDVYEHLSSDKVLTMEYVPGIKISDVKALRAKGISPIDLARKSGESFMLQLLRHGFFHCDPHPGNIAVDRKGPNGSPRLIYYDFGMVCAAHAGIVVLMPLPLAGDMAGAPPGLWKCLTRSSPPFPPQVDTLSEQFRRALVDGFFALFDGDRDQAPKQIVQVRTCGGGGMGTCGAGWVQRATATRPSRVPSPSPATVRVDDHLPARRRSSMARCSEER